MKRGLIRWDRIDTPPQVFERRLASVKEYLAQQGLPAIVVYTDVWRSNQARFFSNFMPYFNRSLLVISREYPPTLICGLSARVYSWIRSTTIIDDIRPGANLVRQLWQLAAERQWQKVGILDLPQLPQEISHPVCEGNLPVTNVESSVLCAPARDENELSVRRKAAQMARLILATELPIGVGLEDHELVGRLERAFRRAGAEDLTIVLTNGRTAPASPVGAVLDTNYSVILGVEYSGHWVRLSRFEASLTEADGARTQFHRLLRDLKGPMDVPVHVENLGGPYPYESAERFGIRPGSIFALHAEFDINGKRVFYGDTCWHSATGAEGARLL